MKKSVLSQAAAGASAAEPVVKVVPENIVKDGTRYQLSGNLANLGSSKPSMVVHVSKDGVTQKHHVCKAPLPYEMNDRDLSVAREVLGGMFNRYVVGQQAPKVTAVRDPNEGKAHVLSRLMQDGQGKRCPDLIGHIY